MLSEEERIKKLTDKIIILEKRMERIEFTLENTKAKGGYKDNGKT